MTTSKRRVFATGMDAAAALVNTNGGAYATPTIATHKVEKNLQNCQIANESHAKATNNGFARGESGRYYR